MIIGLGNPGTRYQDTLHNIGFKVIERLAEKHKWQWRVEKKFQAEMAEGRIGEIKYHLMKPATYMNLSGEAVGAYLSYYRFQPEDLLVIVDDADLPLGDLRLKPYGGSGGHNGLKSIESALGTYKFKRLRIGIGRPQGMQVPLADYVLSRQENGVWEALDKTIVRAEKVLERLSSEKFDAVMKTANTFGDL